MNARSLANHYKQTGASSAVLDASPHQLIAIMLATARERVRLAIASLERGDVTRKAHAITDTCAIIGGLNGALNMEAGGEIAQGLAALYDYCQRRLLAANLNNDAAPLQEIDGILDDIESAWRQIAPKTP